MAKDYYQILGIDKSATAEEIKKAFRRLAHQHHPDKQGGDEAKFKEINGAYQVLSDPEKRQQYDQYGSAFEQTGGAQGFNWQDFQSAGGAQGFDFGNVSDLFGDFFSFGGAGGGRQGRNRAADIHMDQEIEFKESFEGVSRIVSLYKNASCDRCSGSGAEPGTKVSQCTICKGNGRVRRVQNTMLGAMQVETVCANCQGTGEKIETPCKHCGGSGLERKQEEFTFTIPAGIDAGQTLRFSGKGQAGSKGQTAGDLYLTIHVRPHRDFQRQGADILTSVSVPFTTLTLGGEVSVPTMEGAVRLKIPAGTESGKQFILKQKGFTKLNARGRGDELVQVNVAIPTKLTKKQKELLEQLDQQLQGKKGWL